MSAGVIANALSALARFDLFEQSIESRAPVNLYLFKYGYTDQAFRAYTDAELPLMVGGVTYEPESISRTEIGQTGNLDKTTFDIKLPVDNPIVQMTNAGTPSEMIVVYVYEVHTDDPTMTPHQIGKGVCTKRSDADDTTATIAVTSFIGRMNVNIVRRVVTRQCDLMLYQQGRRRCQVKIEEFTTRPLVQAIDGLSLGLASGWVLPGGFTYTYGMVWWEGTDGILHRHTIVDYTATGMRLEALPRGLVPGAAIFAAPNCRHNLGDCKRFRNVANYGGFPFIPTKTVVKDSTSFT